MNSRIRQRKQGNSRLPVACPPPPNPEPNPSQPHLNPTLQKLVNKYSEKLPGLKK